MFPSQVVTAHRRMPASTALMVATGFALGALVGLGVQGALDRASGVGVVSATTPVATSRDMSDAAYAATHPAKDVSAATCEATSPAAARRDDMSAAAYAAMHGAGPAGDMSAAAYAATHPGSTGGR